MKFFIPLATGDAQSERVYIRIADRLRSMGYELNPHRVFKVIFRRDDHLVSETIGAASLNGEIVLAIFGDHDTYFICTYSQGVVWGTPLMALYKETEAIEFFD